MRIYKKRRSNRLKMIVTGFVTYIDGSHFVDYARSYLFDQGVLDSDIIVPKIPKHIQASTSEDVRLGRQVIQQYRFSHVGVVTEKPHFYFRIRYLLPNCSFVESRKAPISYWLKEMISFFLDRLFRNKRISKIARKIWKKLVPYVLKLYVEETEG